MTPASGFKDLEIFTELSEDHHTDCIRSFGSHAGELVLLNTFLCNEISTSTLANRQLELYRGLNFDCFLKLRGLIDDVEHSKLTEVVMYPEGGVLSDILKSDKILGFSFRLNIALSLSKAINYLHSEDIIYNDIRPNKIALDSEWNCKFIDFISAAKVSDIFTPFTTSTKGDRRYQAPEVILEGNRTGASDIFSFGLTIYEILSRQPCWQVMRNPTTCQFDIEKLLKNLPSEASPSLRELLKQMLNEDPEFRPAAEDVFDWIASLVDECTHKNEPLPPIRPPLPFPKHRASLASDKLTGEVLTRISSFRGVKRSPRGSITVPLRNSTSSGALANTVNNITQNTDNSNNNNNTLDENTNKYTNTNQSYRINTSTTISNNLMGDSNNENSNDKNIEVTKKNSNDNSIVSISSRMFSWRPMPLSLSRTPKTTSAPSSFTSPPGNATSPTSSSAESNASPRTMKPPSASLYTSMPVAVASSQGVSIQGGNINDDHNHSHSHGHEHSHNNSANSQSNRMKDVPQVSSPANTGNGWKGDRATPAPIPPPPKEASTIAVTTIIGSRETSEGLKGVLSKKVRKYGMKHAWMVEDTDTTLSVFVLT